MREQEARSGARLHRRVEPFTHCFQTSFWSEKNGRLLENLESSSPREYLVCDCADLSAVHLVHSIMGSHAKQSEFSSPVLHGLNEL